MNVRSLFKNSRFLHRWVGVVCAFFLVILSVTGVLLMHYDELGLNHKEVDGAFLPDKYFQIESGKRQVQALAGTPEGTKLFVGARHGLFRSVDRGKTWTHLKEGLFSQDIRALALSPQMPDIVYAGSPQGIFKSEDGGEHWSDWFDVASGLAHPVVSHLAVHQKDPDIVYAVTNGGLYSSDDGGESWKLSFAGKNSDSPPTIHQVVFSSVDLDTVYLLTNQGVYRKNEESDWENVWEDRLPIPHSLISLSAEPEFFYAGTQEGLYKSFNGGRSWVRDRNNDIESVHLIQSSEKNISHLIVASIDQIFQTKNGGDEWKEISLSDVKDELNAPIKIGDLLYLGEVNHSVLLLASDQGLIVSSDEGKTWRVPELETNSEKLASEDRKMDLVKLITEIHTGRFFGSYFVLLVDLATLGLLGLVFSGFWILYQRNRGRKKKLLLSNQEEVEETMIELQETAEDLSLESTEVHDMIEHIGQHLEKCRTVYLSKERKEIDEIGRHITTLDKKMHRLMERIEEFENISKN
ncbi:MAG: hypothetical protein COV66_10425 [Nitrospinae bacterium CG11_big_fil_rev_8_21_14_0_20_45_15]|nr:MAG: hypothetical protein COV66_10425 [Nitrospinae bacterium CG11_big_fil_rev_8_21_14_0_20_45_15]